VVAAMMPQMMSVVMSVSSVLILSSFSGQPLKLEFIFIDIAKDSTG
jgi:hypothetical protein